VDAVIKIQNPVADPGFLDQGPQRRVTFKKFRPKPPKPCNVTVGLHFTGND